MSTNWSTMHQSIGKSDGVTKGESDEVANLKQLHDVVQGQLNDAETLRDARRSTSSSLGRFGRHLFCTLAQLVNSSQQTSGDPGAVFNETSARKQVKKRPEGKSCDSKSDQGRKLSSISLSSSANAKGAAPDSDCPDSAGLFSNDCCLSLISRATTSISPSHDRKQEPGTTPTRLKSFSMRAKMSDLTWFHLNKSPTAKPTLNGPKQSRFTIKRRTTRQQPAASIKEFKSTSAKIAAQDEVICENNNKQALLKTQSGEILVSSFKHCNSFDSPYSTTQNNRLNYDQQRLRSSNNKLISSKSSSRDKQSPQTSFNAQSSIQSGNSATCQLSQQDDLLIMTDSGLSINNLHLHHSGSSGDLAARNQLVTNPNQSPSVSANNSPSCNLNNAAKHQLSSNSSSVNRHQDQQNKQLQAHNYILIPVGGSCATTREMMELLDGIGEKLTLKMEYENEQAYLNGSRLFFLEDSWNSFVKLTRKTSKITSNKSASQQNSKCSLSKLNDRDRDDNREKQISVGRQETNRTLNDVSGSQETPRDRDNESGEREKLANLMVQQDTIWELVNTENSYIKCLKQIIDVFLFTLLELQKHNLLCDIVASKMTSNIEEVYEANCDFWLHYVYPMLCESRATGKPLNPSLIHDGFLELRQTFKPYYRYCLEHSSCLAYLKDQSKRNETFKVYVSWCESRMDCDRLRLMDLLAKPTQRITRYSLLLKAILRRTNCELQAQDLRDMIANVDRFVLTVDLELRNKDDFERLLEVNSLIESHQLYPSISYNNEEIDHLLANFSRPLELLEPLFHCAHNCHRQLLFDSSSSQFSQHHKSSMSNLPCQLNSSTSNNTATSQAAAAPTSTNIQTGNSSFTRLSPKHELASSSSASSSKDRQNNQQFKFRDASSSNKTTDIVFLLFTDQLLICKQVVAQGQSAAASVAAAASSGHTTQAQSAKFGAKITSNSTANVNNNNSNINRFRQNFTQHNLQLSDTNKQTHFNCNHHALRQQYSHDGCATTTIQISADKQSQSLSGVANIHHHHQQQQHQYGAFARPRSNSGSQRVARAHLTTVTQHQRASVGLINQQAYRGTTKQEQQQVKPTLASALELSASRAVSCILAPSGCLNLASPAINSNNTNNDNDNINNISNNNNNASQSSVIECFMRLDHNKSNNNNNHHHDHHDHHQNHLNHRFLGNKHNTSMSSAHSSVSSLSARDSISVPTPQQPQSQNAHRSSGPTSLFQRSMNSFKRSSHHNNTNNTHNHDSNHEHHPNRSMFGFHNHSFGGSSNHPQSAQKWTHKLDHSSGAGSHKSYKFRLIRSPYPIDKLTMIELKDSKSVLFLHRSDDMQTILNSFIIHLPLGFGFMSVLDNEQFGLRATSSSQETLKFKSHQDSQQPQQQVRFLSQASQLISLICEAQLKLKITKEFHSILDIYQHHDSECVGSRLHQLLSINSSEDDFPDFVLADDCKTIYSEGQDMQNEVIDESIPYTNQSNESDACSNGHNRKRWSFSSSNPNSASNFSRKQANNRTNLCQQSTKLHSRQHNSFRHNTQANQSSSHGNGINQDNSHSGHSLAQSSSRWPANLQKSLIELYRSMLLSHAQFDRLLWNEAHCLSLLEFLVNRPDTKTPLKERLFLAAPAPSDLCALCCVQATTNNAPQAPTKTSAEFLNTTNNVNHSEQPCKLLSTAANAHACNKTTRSFHHAQGASSRFQANRASFRIAPTSFDTSGEQQINCYNKTQKQHLQSCRSTSFGTQMCSEEHDEMRDRSMSLNMASPIATRNKFKLIRRHEYTYIDWMWNDFQTVS